MRMDKIDPDGLTVLLLFVIGIVLLIIIRATDPNPLSSRDEVCQKYFGKDYVWQNEYRSADFCVDNSGVPKYPKTWNERKPNA